jgi:hypothetical protein
VIFGQISANLVLSSSHFSRFDSVSAFNCLGRTLRLANPAIDTFVGVDHQHILAFVKAIDRADLDTVGIFALDTGVSHDIGHAISGKF